MPRKQGLVPFLCRITAVAALVVTPALAVDVTYNTTGRTARDRAIYTDASGPAITNNSNTENTPDERGGYGHHLRPDSLQRPRPCRQPTSPIPIRPSPSPVTNAGTNLLGGAGLVCGGHTLSSTGGNLGGGSGGVSALTTDPLAGGFSFNIGGGGYYFDVTPTDPLTNGGGVSRTTGGSDAPSAPEPAYYALTGTGFAGLLVMATRSRRQKGNSRDRDPHGSL
jgi:hypothetical protein